MLFNFLFAKKERSFMQKRLFKALKEHAGTYTITRDGQVKTDYSHPKVKARVEAIFESLEKIKVK